MASVASRATRIVGLVLAGIVALLLLVAAGAWWWAGTEGSTEWVLRQAAKSQPLQAEGVRGSLRHGLQARRLAWEKEGLKVEAFDADLAWNPWALIQATVRLDRLHAQRLRFEDRRPPKPSAAPTDFVLPMRVEIGDLKVGQVQWVTSSQSVEVADIAGSYSFDAARHRVRLANLRWMGGTYAGEATLGAHDPMPLDATLRGQFATAAPGGGATVPLRFTATLNGPLQTIRVQAQLRGQPDSPTAGTEADVRATLTPWAAQPVPEAQADFVALDAGAIWPQAPRTRLDGHASLRPVGASAWAVQANVTNAEPGPWDRRRLPVSRAVVDGEWRSGSALIREVTATAGGGQVRATGEWKSQGAWTVDGEFKDIDPGALHTAMAAVPISGKARLEGEGPAVGFAVDLRGEAPLKQVGGLELKSVLAHGRWAEGLLTLASLEVRTPDASLSAKGEARPQARSGTATATLTAPGLQAQVDGRISEIAGQGQARISSGNLTQALAWLSRFPGVPGQALANVAGGRADLDVGWRGGWRDPAVQARATLPLLEMKGEAPAWHITDATVTVDGRLADAAVEARGRATQGQRRIDAQVAGRLGRRDAKTNSWQGRFDTLQASAVDPALGNGPWTLTLQRAFDWRFGGGSFESGAGEARLVAPRAGEPPALLAWEPVRFGQGQLRTSGRLSGLPLAWVELFGGVDVLGSAITGDMVFDAQWDAVLGDTPRIRATLARTRGDLTVLAENVEGQSAKVPAGVRVARVSVSSEGEAVTAALEWDSERGGNAQGRVATRLARGASGGWEWPANAPLDGSLRAHLPRIGVWSLLAPPGWRLRGSLEADVRIAGTRSDPRLAGTVSADDLALRSVVDGIALQGGRLRARLDGQRIVIDEFSLRGQGDHGGVLTAKGEASMGAQGPVAQLTAQLDRLRASIRSDRQLNVSGTVNARRDAQGTAVDGKLRIDQALIVLPDEGTPRLGDDVVVRNAAGPVTRREAKAREQASQPASQKLQVALDLDLGNDFRVQGMGVDARLRGTLAVTAQSIASPRLVGTIRADGGEYRAYGQRLTIERGVIRFTGPIDNPNLDVLAIRPRLAQRVGVLVTGTALAPYVRLYSEPDLPEAEKLAWLVTGRAAPATGAETALVQQAALALLASRSGGGGKGIAQRLGLDELSFRREGANGPSVTLGKRITDRFYAAYERGLSGALGTLYIFYDITGKVTLRGQAGERTALDLIYTFEFN